MTDVKTDVIHYTPNDDLDKIVKENANVIVDFTASWCGPCQKLGPILEDKTKQGAGKFKLVKIDVDENAEISEKYKVGGIPFVILFVDGKQVSDFTGADTNKLDQMIKQMK